jgi:hypothetical protein
MYEARREQDLQEDHCKYNSKESDLWACYRDSFTIFGTLYGQRIIIRNKNIKGYERELRFSRPCFENYCLPGYDVLLSKEAVACIATDEESALKVQASNSSEMIATLYSLHRRNQ